MGNKVETSVSPTLVTVGTAWGWVSYKPGLNSIVDVPKVREWRLYRSNQTDLAGIKPGPRDEGGGNAQYGR